MLKNSSRVSWTAPNSKLAKGSVPGLARVKRLPVRWGDVTRLAQQGVKRPPDRCQHDVLSRLIRMNAICLKILPLVGKAFKQKGHQGSSSLRRGIGEDIFKTLRVFSTVVWWDLHAYQNHLSACRLTTHDHLSDIFLSECDGQPTQGVIGAKFENHNCGVM